MGPEWQRYRYWLVVFVLALLWFSTLQYRYLISPDEGRYAEIAREMVQSGNWLTPHLNGLKYFEKPALQYWASAFFFQTLGISEFTARLWPALTGFLAAFFIGFAASRLWDKETGQIATLVLISCLWWVGNGHFLSLDMGLNAFLAVSLGSFLLAQRADATAKETCGWMMVAWAATALAMLSKGVISLAITGMSVLLYSLWQREWRLWCKLHIGKGIILFLFIVAPWFILVSLENPTFAYFFFIGEHILRYATDASRRAGPIYYFVLPLLVGLLPWASFLPQALRKISYQRTKQFSPEKFLLVWAGFIFVFFSISSSKLPSYILPLFPALALLIARFIHSADMMALRIHVKLLMLPVLLCVVGAAVMYVLPANAARMALNQAFAGWLVVAAVVFMLCAIAAWWYTKRANKWGVLGCFVAAGLIAAQVPMLGHRVYGAQHSGYFLANAIQPYLRPATAIYSIGFYDQTLPFYLRRTLKLVNYEGEFKMGLNLEPANKISLAQFIAQWTKAGDQLALMHRYQYEALRAQSVPMRVVVVIGNTLAVIPE